MGFWAQRRGSARGMRSTIELDLKIIRFQRLVGHHGELLDLLADMKEKQSADYILDRRYIEAQLDRAYEGVRQMVYDTHAITGSNAPGGYEQLDRLRSRSEKILREASTSADARARSSEEEDWETLALRSLHEDFTRAPGYRPGHGAGQPLPEPESLWEWAAWAHVEAAQWITDHLPSLAGTPIATLADDEDFVTLLVEVFVIGGGTSGTGEALRQGLSGTGTGSGWAATPVPFRYFLQGTNQGLETAQAHLCEPSRRACRSLDEVVRIGLYAGEGLLMLRLPPIAPLRLFWSALSFQEGENRTYLYGTHPTGSLTAAGPLAAAGPSPGTYPEYRLVVGSRWASWSCRFTWAQGEELVRMLGRAIGGCVPPGLRDGAAREKAGERLRAGIIRFVEQVVSDGVSRGGPGPSRGYPGIPESDERPG